MPDVIYKDIDSHDIMPGWYKIGSDGSLINSTGKKAKFFCSNTGYYRINLVLKNHLHQNFSIHRLVAEYFIPNPDNLPVVNHLDGNKLNNDYTNLEWTTYSGNWYHALRTLKSITNIGETMWSAKYSVELVTDICELLAIHPYKSNEIIQILHLVDDPTDKYSKEYFCMKKLIKNIRQRRCWKLVSESYIWAK